MWLGLKEPTAATQSGWMWHMPQTVALNVGPGEPRLTWDRPRRKKLLEDIERRNQKLISSHLELDDLQRLPDLAGTRIYLT